MQHQILVYLREILSGEPVPLAARSKAYVLAACLLRAGSNPTWAIDVFLRVYMLCCSVSVEAFTTGSSLVQSPAACLIRLDKSESGCHGPIRAVAKQSRCTPWWRLGGEEV
jgi:hypothetical protein